MICEICKQRPASITITSNMNGVNKVQHVCPVCAQEKNLMVLPPQFLDQLAQQNLPPIIDSLLKQFNQPSFDKIFEMFSEHAKRVLVLAQEETSRLGHQLLDTGHLLLALIKEEGVVYRIFLDQGLDIVNLFSELEAMMGRGEGNHEPPSSIKLSPRAKKVLELAYFSARELRSTYMGPEHILIGLLREAEGLAAIYLNKKNITLSMMMDLLHAIAQKADPDDEIHRLFGGGMQAPQVNDANASGDVFSQFGRDLTRLASENKLDPVIGRDQEVERIIRILSRRTKNNPVLIGDPGVGKTAIVEGLAQAIINGEVPEDLKNKRVIELQLSSVLAGTRFRGDFEERFKRLIDTATQKDSQIILFIDELHTVVGAGSVGDNAMDAANILKPALARGEIQCIGATTIDEYRKYIEKDSALERRFQKIDVSEPSKDEAILILKGLRDKYEAYHRVDIDDEVIQAAVDMSSRYITDRFLPDKAIDLIDEAAAMVRIRSISLPENIKDAQKELQSIKKDEIAAARNQEYEKAARYRDRIDQLEKWIREERETWMAKKGAHIVKIRKEDIQRVVADWTKMPVSALKENETQKYLDIEGELQKKIIGQKEAIQEISRVLKRARSGLKNPDRPIGAFLFSGPTGVGKTELANVLTEYILGDRHKLIRFDMSEYMEKFNVSKLLGAPPGYVGYNEAGQLTEKVRRNPYSVILFDEIEKAHPEIFNVLLQILDSGTMADSQGRKIDFKNCLILMTTNMGSSQLKNLGFRSSDTSSAYETMKQNVVAEIKNHFRIEFINRLSGIVVFKPLIQEDMLEIFNLMIHNIEDRLAEQSLSLEISPSLKTKIITESDFEQFGARSLGRIIERDIEDFLAQALLTNTPKKGTRLVLGLNKHKEMILKSHASC